MVYKTTFKRNIGGSWNSIQHKMFSLPAVLQKLINTKPTYLLLWSYTLKPKQATFPTKNDAIQPTYQAY
jgi:hypothetical protein